MKKWIFILALSCLGSAVMAGGEHKIRKVENPHAEEAAAFPGSVPEKQSRLKNVKVTVDGDYNGWGDELRISRIKTPWIRTGLYLPPGELITVEVPKGLSGVEYRITAFHCKLNPEKVKKMKRFPDVRKMGKLIAGKNEISSDFGGHLYILFPDGAPGKKVNFKVTGAVKSPDFILGETDPERWKQEVAESGTPWGEMICDRVIFTLPIASMQKITDPVGMMTYYKEMIEQDYNAYSGLTDNHSDKRHRSPDLPWRFVFDVQLCAGAAHAGYPIAASYYWADRSIDMDLMRNSDKAWGFYHEIGHNYQTWCWKWGTLGEVSCNFPIFHARNRDGRWPGRVDSYQKIVDEMANKDFEGKNFDNAPFGHESRIVPFIQLAQQYSWKLYQFLARESRELSDADIAALQKAGNDGRRDFFCRKVAEFAKRDMRPFLDAWGIKYSDSVAVELAGYPALQTKFWTVFDETKIPEF